MLEKNKAFRRKLLFSLKDSKLRDEIKKIFSKEGLILAGFPRYPRIFGRDSLITSWELLEFDPSIARKTLIFLSRFQGKRIDKERDEEPGKILHETDPQKKKHPLGYFPFPYYGSVDSTPLFLILFSFYWRKTKDKRFVRLHKKNILAALDWIFNFGDKDKDFFLEYKRKKKTGLFHQGWKDNFKNHLKISPPVAIVEVQGYQYLALKEIAKMAKELFREKGLEKRLLERAESLKERFNKLFWMDDKNFYALALDKNKKQKKSITSNPGHLLFTGICDKEKERLLVRRLFRDDLWTPYGIRTLSEKDPDFNYFKRHLGCVWPHDNWIIAQGLKKQGYKKEYERVKKAILAAYKELSFLPEFYGVKDKKIILNTKPQSCYLQAWSLGALINFLNN